MRVFIDELSGLYELRKSNIIRRNVFWNVCRIWSNRNRLRISPCGYEVEIVNATHAVSQISNRGA